MMQRGFEMVGPIFENDEEDLLAYFERTYGGRRVGAGRTHPLFRIGLRKVRNRTGAGRTMRLKRFAPDSHRESLRGTIRRFGHLARSPALDGTSQIKTS